MKKIPHLIYCFVLFICLTSSIQVMAKQVDNLYRAQTEVVNQSSKVRNEAIKRLFAAVLIKVSGKSAVMDNVKVMEAASNAQRFLTDFNYLRDGSRLLLRVSFNETVIDDLLKSNGVSIWGSQRPSVMLWLAYENENQRRQIVSESDATVLERLIKEQSQQRGLPLLLPLWDLDDQMQLSTTDIWALFGDKVAQVNQRYASNYMILSRIGAQGLFKRLDWAIYKVATNGSNQFDSGMTQKIVGSGSEEVESIEQAMRVLVNQSTDFFASQYSVDTTEEQGKLEFVVNNIESLEQFVGVTNYLNAIKAVESVNLVSSIGSRYTFSVRFLGNKLSLIDGIALEQKLIVQPMFTSEQNVYMWHR
ncbi:DUF2066 domain-containing protein [Psychrobium sp. 1_MG-2023]|uniref:DUF2066 domain-containing protein n=1 Tax=Psychrobium sp. 1_MG-2023 TaxID=3062624 RepID=UPI0027335B4A|nr:DUF2066 domain-containing protein [Psychrobium sp. 1_MG-2023]MDP2560297.1 DUF2066 domain-containing protein [Psychrobium sp. 1_MG-2023]